MKVPILSVIVLAVLSLACILHAGDLNAPAAKPVTVRSEIERGYAAALTAASESDGPEELIDAMLKLGATNQQARTDSDAFGLGMCFGEWRSLWETLSLGVTTSKHGQVKIDLSLVANFADAAHGGFRTWAQKLNLTDDQLREVLGIHNYDPVQDEAAWANAFKTKQFKGSMPVRN